MERDEISKKIWKTALYCRLSREDGDRPESDSIGNQRRLLTEYVQARPELAVHDCYIDDGYTGTNFDRPAFQRMLRDIEAGKVDCVLVKDLSRFGRDYIDAGRYLERWLPAHGARFVAVTDDIDSSRGTYDMTVPLKNLFNAQYAKDISMKVKSALHTKQRRGEFIGAFPSYGYLKDPENRNHLVVDPVAAEVVRQIFTLFEEGHGKIGIAKILNGEGVPCPSVYKRLMGERYRNSSRLERTTYWTYATIHRILQSEVYIGNLEQGRDDRAQLHGAARRKKKTDWIVVRGTHEPIVSQEQWKRVQALLRGNVKTPDFTARVSLFAGFLKCGDCGRAMVRTQRKGSTYYTCGSYKRYGPTACTRHEIAGAALEAVVLRDLNRIVAGVKDLRRLAERGQREALKTDTARRERERLSAALDRVRKLGQGAYEDYRERLLSKEEYLRYRQDYTVQEETLARQMERLDEAEDAPDRPWVEELVQLGRLTELDRATLAETVREIRVFEGGQIEIVYLFSKELRTLLEDGQTEL